MKYLLSSVSMVAVLGGVAAPALADGYFEGVLGLASPIADDDYDNFVDGSLKLGVRAGSGAGPGAVEFTKYADSKGVKVLYITNRDAATEKDTRANMEKLGFPMGGNVDTFMMQNEQKDWASAKSTRRAVVTRDYRVLLNIGDNFGDFTDDYKGTEAERLQVFEANADHWGKEWIGIYFETNYYWCGYLVGINS